MLQRYLGADAWQQCEYQSGEPEFDSRGCLVYTLITGDKKYGLGEIFPEYE